MNGMSKKLIDWLWKATDEKNNGNANIFFIQNGSSMVADGKRIHAINSAELPDIINGINIKDAFSVFDNADIQTTFTINPKFLREALSGFDDEVNLALVDNGPSFQAIIINSSFSENEAYIMCMKRSK